MLSKWVVLLWTIVGGAIFPLASVWAWEVNTHEELTKEAITVVEANLGTYLIDNLGLEGGLNESLPGGAPISLMQQGSNDEDNGIRFFRHFHDPISNAGLAYFDSAINWSLRSIGNQGGDAYSWNDAREYYFKALTSPTKTERDENWSKTFRALGHVMHLIQDSANPSHVRDDPHPFDDGLHDYMERRSVGSYIGSGIFSPDSSILEQGGATRSEPFSNLFDRDIYMGGNPGSTLGNDVGITEYTNANFFSDDTIAGQRGIAPAHPSVSELVPATTIPFGLQYLTLPRLGTPSEFKARVAKYSGNQALSKFSLANLQLDLLGQLRMDELVYEAYSTNLIPRAVGYSATVLNYFFRGEIEVIEQTYRVRAQNLGGPFCNQTPADDFGYLQVGVEIPVDLNFGGTASFYYDGSNETRNSFGQYTNAPSGEELFFGGTINPGEIPNPTRWYLVLEGQAGPGAQEPQAIVAKTGLAEWQFDCVH